MRIVLEKGIRSASEISREYFFIGSRFGPHRDFRCISASVSNPFGDGFKDICRFNLSRNS